MNGSNPLRIRLDDRDAASSALLRPILAGLASRFRVTDTATADVTVVSGRHAQWPGRVLDAVHDGARGVLVVRPTSVDPATVRAVSAAIAGRSVVAVDTPYLNDRTWTAIRHDIAADAARSASIDSLITVAGGDLADALMDQVAVLSTLTDLGHLRTVHRNTQAYLLAGHDGRSSVTLAAAAGAAQAGLAVDVVAPNRRWQVRFDATALARPTEITMHDRHGARTQPLLYESSHRVTCQQMHEAIVRGGTVGWSLDDLAETLTIVHRTRTLSATRSTTGRTA